MNRRLHLCQHKAKGASSRPRRDKNTLEVGSPAETHDEVIGACAVYRELVDRDTEVEDELVPNYRRGDRRPCAEHQSDQGEG